MRNKPDKIIFDQSMHFLLNTVFFSLMFIENVIILLNTIDKIRYGSLW